MPVLPWQMKDLTPHEEQQIRALRERPKQEQGPSSLVEAVERGW